MLRRSLCILGTSCVIGLVACTQSQCPETACDSLETRSEAQNQMTGIAGVIADETASGDLDESEGQCAPCPFGSTDLSFWSTAAIVTSATDAENVISSGAPEHAIRVEGHYQEGLAAGTWLACTKSICFGFDVAERKVTTVNVKQNGAGPLRIVIFDPDSLNPRDAHLLRVEPQ